MKSVYDFSDYRVALRTWIASSSIKGYQARLAAASGISASLLSLILKGEKNLSLEQAVGLSEYFGFDSEQTQYFFLLVEIGRAGTEKLKVILKKRAAQMRMDLGKRIGGTEEIPDAVKSIYYSNWLYTGIRNYLATADSSSPEHIAMALKLPVPTVMRVLHFLKAQNLIFEERGRLKVAQKKIHIDKSSHFAQRHHANWRMKAMSEMNQENENNIHFTSPMSLSLEAAQEIKNRLPKMIEEIMAIVGPSPSEQVYCLNLDWFQYGFLEKR